MRAMPWPAKVEQRVRDMGQVLPLIGVCIAFPTVILPGNIFTGEHDGHEFYGSRASVVWKA